MPALDAAVASVTITFVSVIEEGDQVATRHLDDSVTRQGHRSRYEVIAIFGVGLRGILFCPD